MVTDRRCCSLPLLLPAGCCLLAAVTATCFCLGLHIWCAKLACCDLLSALPAVPVPLQGGAAAAGEGAGRPAAAAVAG